ncbi:MAG: hypothetical protein JXB13_02465 [Phycisphaerae bacterium]|nr:hypothetical protein [Phycisphaerae bacterium]
MRDDDTTLQNESQWSYTLLCPHCMASNPPNVDFCRNCGAPIGASSVLDPMKAIQAQGWMYRKAIRRGTSFFVALGIWLIFGPSTIINAIMLISLLSGWRHASGPLKEIVLALLFTLLVASFLLLQVAILYRATKSYWKTRAHRPGTCAECGYDLTGLSENRCPECATPFDPPDPDDPPTPTSQPDE